MGMVDAVKEGDVIPMNTADIRTLHEAHVLNTVGGEKLALVRGENTALWDADGNEYLDFFAGLAVANLGHCHPEVTEAICDQARKLVHVSNLYYIESQVLLANFLADHTFADRWFFCNSGAESNEGAIKLARRYWAQRGTPKPTIVTAYGGFHGRTMAALKATAQPKYHEGFEPLIEGFKYVDYNDIEALEKALTPDVGAVLLEPIQGEGGVIVPAKEYLANVRRLCDEKDVLLILDEVQTGVGRTGTFFAHTQYGITPDIMCVAKALGNGVPIGAIGCTEDAATGFSLGSHASTFGGNPLCTAAALATVKAITAPGFLEHAAETGAYFMEQLEGLKQKHSCIVHVRGAGLIIGVEMTQAVMPIVHKLTAAGIIAGPAGANVLRFLPPLTITKSNVDTVVSALDEVLGQS